MAYIPVENLFVVMADPMDLSVAAAVERIFKDKSKAIRPGQWFVIAPGTAVEVSATLGVTASPPSTGPAVIVTVTSYYGKASPLVWEWLKANYGVVGRA